MQLPGRLSASTLGDLLGVLHRGKTTGMLELTEVPTSIHGAVAGRQHRIHLFCGLVSGVETSFPVPPLGEILYDRGLIGGDALVALMRHLGRRDGRLVGEILVAERLASTTFVAAGLRTQAKARLERLFRLRDALVTFHTARPLSAETRGAGLLGSDDFLRGRPRARDRAPYSAPHRAAEHRAAEHRAAAPAADAHAAGAPPSQPDRRVSPNRPWNTRQESSYEPSKNEPYRSEPQRNEPYRSEPPRNEPYRSEPQRNEPRASGPRAHRAEPPPYEHAAHEAPPRSRVTSRDAPRDKALRTLGLTDGADERAIRRAFRRLAVELHPDKFATAPAEKRARTSALFAEVSAAYHLLVA